MALLWVYNASVDSLIHLYVIGVFTAFTLSQAGMVRYWLRTREPGWRHKIVINAVGATATGLVTLVVIWTKFAEGAWLVIVAIPLLVARVPRHQPPLPPLRAAASGGHGRGRGRTPRRRTRCCSRSTRSTSRPRARSGTRGRSRRPSAIRALHRPGPHTDSGHPGALVRLRRGEPRLEILPTNEGRMQALLEEVWSLPRGESDFVTVVVPEQFRRALAALGRGRDVVPAQAPAAVGAGRRRHRRARL